MKSRYRWLGLSLTIGTLIVLPQEETSCILGNQITISTMSGMQLSSTIADHQIQPLTLQENLSVGEPTWCALPMESFHNNKGITKTEVELLITEAIRSHEFRTTVHAMFMVVVVYTAGFVSAFFFFLTH